MNYFEYNAHQRERIASDFVDFDVPEESGADGITVVELLLPEHDCAVDA
jgi:hypothetical protein